MPFAGMAAGFLVFSKIKIKTAKNRFCFGRGKGQLAAKTPSNWTYITFIYALLKCQTRFSGKEAVGVINKVHKALNSVSCTHIHCSVRGEEERKLRVIFYPKVPSTEAELYPYSPPSISLQYLKSDDWQRWRLIQRRQR